MAHDFKKMKENLRDAISKLTPEEKEKYFPENKTPKGWVSIEDALPHWMAKDVAQGYSIYKVKDKDGTEFSSLVCDHTSWYYFAKDGGITHWFNE